MSWVNGWTHVCWPTLALPKSPCCIISVGSHYISVWCRHYVSQHIHTHIYISSHPFKRRFFSPYKHPCGHGFHAVLEAMIFKREYEEGWHLVVFEWRWMVIFQVGNTRERWSVGKKWKNLFFGGWKKKTWKIQRISMNLIWCRKVDWSFHRAIPLFGLLGSSPCPEKETWY